MNLAAWLQEGTSVTLGQILTTTITLLNQFIEFRHPQEPVLIACWILGTYFHPLCLTYPRLNIQGEKGSGKSKLLSLIAHLSFNGMLHITPSPAVLYRLIAPLRPTICIDEAESLAGEDNRALLAIVNAGYKAGVAVSRCGGSNYEQVKSFEVFCPLAFGGIRGLNATTEDRAISIILQRGTDLNRINAEVDPQDPQIAWVRNQSYRLLLGGFSDFKNVVTNLQFPPWLNGRHRELYKPLLAIANWGDQSFDHHLQENILYFAAQEWSDRNSPSSEAQDLLSVLKNRLGDGEQILIYPKDLVYDITDPMGKPMSPEKVGHALRRLGFIGKRDDMGTRYQIDRTQIENIRSRYPQF